jgi:hypothetical protein
MGQVNGRADVCFSPVIGQREDRHRFDRAPSATFRTNAIAKGSSLPMKYIRNKCVIRA